MSRVAHIPSSDLPAKAAAYEQYASGYGPFRNQVAVFAHVPPAVEHIMGLLLELKKQKNIKWRYVELAIVVTSKLNQCHYCVGHHTAPLMVEGLSRAAIDRLPDIADNPELDEVDRLVVEYTTAVTQNAQRIRDSMFDRLRAHFTEAQIVELTLRITLCGFFNRFNDALQIDDELAHVDFDAPQSGAGAALPTR
jgi:AhpD family alkylhydroperoxidase